MHGNHYVKCADRGVSCDVVVVRVNSTDDPTIVEDRGGVLAQSGHSHDSTGSMTLLLRQPVSYLRGIAQCEGADDNDAKISAVSAANGTLTLITKTAGSLANLTAKNVVIFVWSSKSPRG